MPSHALRIRPATVRSRRTRRCSGRIIVALTLAVVTVQRVAAQSCVGDCDRNGRVAINELILGVNIALGSQPLSACPAFDCTGNGAVPINCIVQGVNSSLEGCTPAPTIALTGSCLVPGAGSNGLTACPPGTPITAFRCDDRSQCLREQGRTMVAATTVTGAGAWSLEIPIADAGATLVLHAGVATGITYRTVVFGVRDAAPTRSTAGVGVAPAAITPATEAGVRLLDGEGLANYSDGAAQAVLDAVTAATAELSYDGQMLENAISFALQAASADATVMMTLQHGRNTPTPSATVTNAPPPSATASAAPPTATATAPLPTATASRPASRFIDNGDGTITDQQTELTWEKKDRAGGLHDVRNEYQWSGNCPDGSGYCQPDAAAAATCAAATGDPVGCGQCPAPTTCDTGGLGTIWTWLNDLNASNFAGHNDWRIPSVGEDGGTPELDTLVGPCSRDGCGPLEFKIDCVDGCTVTTCSCLRSPSEHYWSSTLYPPNPNVAWVMSVTRSGDPLILSDRFLLFGTGLNARAVRGGS
jgi:hypothetical protein